MKILDFECFGNIVKLYLGETTVGIFGDDWDDTPYEHNAGTVYDRFYSKTVEIAFPLSTSVFEPCYGYLNSPYCKNDMLFRKVPFLMFGDVEDAWTYGNFGDLLREVPTLNKLYIGDDWEDVLVKYGDFFTIVEDKQDSECDTLQFEFSDHNKLGIAMSGIGNLVLRDIITSKDIEYTNFGGKKETSTEIVHFVKMFLPKENNVIYSIIDGHTTTVFQRLSEKSIKAIALLNGDNVLSRYEVTFKDDINSGILFENVYQYTKETSDGLHIIITDDLDELQYFKDTEAETKLFEEDWE